MHTYCCIYMCQLGLCIVEQLKMMAVPTLHVVRLAVDRASSVLCQQLTVKLTTDRRLPVSLLFTVKWTTEDFQLVFCMFTSLDPARK